MSLCWLSLPPASACPSDSTIIRDLQFLASGVNAELHQCPDGPAYADAWPQNISLATLHRLITGSRQILRDCHLSAR